jgi:RNA polymerase sigma-70 factor (ECF subfamily)
VQNQDEATLIERAKRLDRAALSELYKRHVQAIYRYVYYRVGDVEVAEDLVSEVFLKALEGIESFTYRGVPFASWLYRIARARVIDYFRRQAKRDYLPLDETLVAGKVEPYIEGEARLQHEELRLAIARLTEDQQQVIILRFIEGLSNATVAQILGKTEGAVKSLQHRALASLQRIMAKGN